MVSLYHMHAPPKCRAGRHPASCSRGRLRPSNEDTCVNRGATYPRNVRYKCTHSSWWWKPRKATRRPARKATRRPARKATRRPVRKATRRPARKATRRPARKATRRPVRKATRRPARKATRRPARKRRG